MRRLCGLLCCCSTVLVENCSPTSPAQLWIFVDAPVECFSPSFVWWGCCGCRGLAAGLGRCALLMCPDWGHFRPAVVHDVVRLIPFMWRTVRQSVWRLPVWPGGVSRVLWLLVAICVAGALAAGWFVPVEVVLSTTSAVWCPLTFCMAWLAGEGVARDCARAVQSGFPARGKVIVVVGDCRVHAWLHDCNEIRTWFNNAQCNGYILLLWAWSPCYTCWIMAWTCNPDSNNYVPLGGSHSFNDVLPADGRW